MMKKPWRTGPNARPTSGLSANGGARLAKASPQTVRGRISNPIPMASSTDDEFPIRQPGTGIAITPGEEPKEVHETATVGTPVPEESFGGDGDEARPDSTILEPLREPNETEHVKIEEPTPAAGDSESGPHTTPTKPVASQATLTKAKEQHPNPTNNVRHSVVSSDTARTKSSKGRTEKKKSGLRGALGKLFGRRRKTDSMVESSAATPDQQDPANHHHSDPQAMRREPSKLDAKRSVSLPITDYDRALRSHSIGPDDVIAIDSARNSVAADGVLSRRRPGAASTHLIGVRRTRDSEWVGLSPRPASTHGPQAAKRDESGEGEEDPAEIGRAITSDYIGLKRRSRSLTYLADLPQDEDGGARRSNELRFWRQSYEPNLMSPISSNAEDTDIGPLPMDVNPAQPHDVAPSTPLQPFTFGDIATMNEMAGMRITEAVSMDSRIGSLEARMQRMEQVVTQLCSTVPNFKPRLDPPTRVAPAPPGERFSGYATSIAPLKMSAYAASGRDVRTSTRPSTQQSQMSRTSFGDAPTFVDSGSRGPGASAQGQGLKGTKDRPMSNATIRGATSLPHLSKDANKPFTIDHYTTLMALIDTERSARQALEAQVKVLGHQVQIMSKTIRKRNGRTNSTASGIQRSAFDVDEDDEDELHAALSRTQEPYTRPSLEKDDDDSETFTTPHEDGQTFDDQMDEAEERRRKTERTLSLSRLTLGAAL